MTIKVISILLNLLTKSLFFFTRLVNQVTLNTTIPVNLSCHSENEAFGLLVLHLIQRESSVMVAEFFQVTESMLDVNIRLFKQ